MNIRFLQCLIIFIPLMVFGITPISAIDNVSWSKTTNWDGFTLYNYTNDNSSHRLRPGVWSMDFDGGNYNTWSVGGWPSVTTHTKFRGTHSFGVNQPTYGWNQNFRIFKTFPELINGSVVLYYKDDGDATNTHTQRVDNGVNTRSFARLRENRWFKFEWDFNGTYVKQWRDDIPYSNGVYDGGYSYVYLGGTTSTGGMLFYDELRGFTPGATSYFTTPVIDAGIGMTPSKITIDGQDIGGGVSYVLKYRGSTNNETFSEWYTINSSFDINNNEMITTYDWYRYGQWYVESVATNEDSVDGIEYVGIEYILAGEGPITTNDSFILTLDVLSGQNTALQAIDTSFGNVIAGNTSILSPSFNLTNSGNTNTIINAKFTTENNSIYGLTNSSGVIGGGNFSLQKDSGTWDALDNLIGDTTMTDIVLADNVVYNWNARLAIPAGQTEALYTGIIQLTFS